MRREQLGLPLAVDFERAAGAVEVGAQGEGLARLPLQVVARGRERGEVRAQGRHLLAVAPGEGAHEPVAAQHVRRPLHGEQHAHVGELAHLVEGARPRRQLRAGLGDGRVELAYPAHGRVHLLVRAMQDELRLAQLLAAQAHLQLQALHVGEQALLLAAQAGHVALDRLLALADAAQALVGGGGRSAAAGGDGARRRRALRLGERGHARSGGRRAWPAARHAAM